MTLWFKHQRTIFFFKDENKNLSIKDYYYYNKSLIGVQNWLPTHVLDGFWCLGVYACHLYFICPTNANLLMKKTMPNYFADVVVC